MAASTSTATFNYAQNIVPIFTGESYDFWSTQMKTLFISQDLWDLIEEGYEQPDDLSTLAAAKLKEYKQNKQRDARALLFIQQGVSKTIFPRISGATKSKEAWEIFKKQFSGYDKVISIKLQNLWREFDNLQMKENETVQEFFSKVSAIINQIRGYGDNINDQKIVKKILRSLSVKFEHVVAAIEEDKDLSKLTLDELCGSLEAHEKRMGRFSTQSFEQAIQSKVKSTE